MSERAVVYTVRVRPLAPASGKYKTLADPEGYLPLGSIDTRGTRLIDRLASYLKDDFRPANSDGSTIVAAQNVAVDGDFLFTTFTHGQTNERALLTGPNNEFKFRQTLDDTHSVRCGCLFELPHSQVLGWVALHVHNGRRYKGLVERELAAKLKADTGDLVLEMHTFVLPAVLRQAVRDGRVKRVVLVGLGNPSDPADAMLQKWVPLKPARLRVNITAGRGQYVDSTPLLKYFESHDPGDKARILEFRGRAFEEAAVEVVLQDGTSRTFNIDDQESGAPMSQTLSFAEDDEDGPSPESIRTALSAVLQVVR